MKNLTIDIQAAYCPDTCCRMPVEILKMGSFGANAGASGAGGQASGASAASSSSGGGGASTSAAVAGGQAAIIAFGAEGCARLPKFVSIIGYLSMNEYRAAFAAAVGEKGVKRKKGGSKRLDLSHVSLFIHPFLE